MRTQLPSYDERFRGRLSFSLCIVNDVVVGARAFVCVCARTPLNACAAEIATPVPPQHMHPSPPLSAPHRIQLQQALVFLLLAHAGFSISRASMGVCCTHAPR